MTIGERIKEKRVEAQLTQEELAKKINSTKQTIYKYENNIITSIPIEKVTLIANALGVLPMELMGWDKEWITKANRAEDGYYDILNDIYQTVSKVTADDDTPNYILEHADTKLVLSEDILMECYSIIKDMIPRTISFLIKQENQKMMEDFASRLSLCGATVNEAFQLQTKYRTLLEKARKDIKIWNQLSEHEIDLLNIIKNSKYTISKFNTREEAINYLNHLWEANTVKALQLEEKGDGYLIDFANQMKASYPYIE